MRLSVARRRIDVLLDDGEIARRLAGHACLPAPGRGYRALYHNTVTQADRGCDLDFLIPTND